LVSVETRLSDPRLYEPALSTDKSRNPQMHTAGATLAGSCGRRRPFCKLRGPPLWSRASWRGCTADTWYPIQRL